MKHESRTTAGTSRLAAMFAWVAIGISGCLPGGGGDETADGPSHQVVLDWSGHTRAVLQAETGSQDPLVGTRTLAMVHIAMHDAVNATDRQYEPYAFAAMDDEADAVAAAATAAHDVLAALFPGQSASLDGKLADSLAAVADGSVETKGVALGKQVAAEIVQRRANDGSAAVVNYAPSAQAGRFQFVPPFDGVIFRPEWRFVTPFGLASAAQFGSAAPPALNSAEYRDAFDEVKSSGVLAGSTRSADQTAYAKFWYEDSDIGWNNITRDVVVRKKLSLHDTARLFALLNIALADAYIAGWDAKFQHDFWRPITAIRAAADDGNDATVPDAGWVPLLDTPPVQDHPSTHSIAGAAAAFVLASALGDASEFSLTSSTAEDPKVARSYRRFSEAANENADSRVKAGIHFRFAANAGLALGSRIGEHVYNSRLRHAN